MNGNPSLSTKQMVPKEKFLPIITFGKIILPYNISNDEFIIVVEVVVVKRELNFVYKKGKNKFVLLHGYIFMLWFVFLTLKTL